MRHGENWPGLPSVASVPGASRVGPALLAVAILAACSSTERGVGPSTGGDAGTAHPLEPGSGDAPAALVVGRDAGPPRVSDAGTEIDFTGLVINEVDYDQVSVDYDEFVELYNGAATALPLEGFALVFSNGTGEYARVDLSGTVPKGGYVLVASPTVKGLDGGAVLRFPLPAASNAMQNTAPQAVGLLDTTQGVLFDSVSCGGAVVGATVTGVTDPLDFVEGTAAASDSNTTERSLARGPNGVDTDDNSADFKATKTITPGAANVITP